MTDGLLINSYRHATAAPKSITYLQLTGDAANLTTYTFSAVNLGAASAGRYIVCAPVARIAGGTTLTIASVTIGGVAATQIVQAENSPTNACVAGIYVAAVPTGTTGDVVVTFSHTVGRCGIHLWSATGISTTASDSDSSVANPGTATLDTTASGVLVAVHVAGTSGANYTWTNATERYDGEAAGAEPGTWTTAADAATSAGTLAVTTNPGGGVSDPVTVFASW